jgi:hypothetical protein
MNKILTRATRLGQNLERKCVHKGEIVGVESTVFALSVRAVRCEHKSYLAGLI